VLFQKPRSYARQSVDRHGGPPAAAGSYDKNENALNKYLRLIRRPGHSSVGCSSAEPNSASPGLSILPPATRARDHRTSEPCLENLLRALSITTKICEELIHPSDEQTGVGFGMLEIWPVKLLHRPDEQAGVETNNGGD